MTHTFSRAILASSALVTVLSLAAQPALAAVVVVTPTSMGDWAFDNRDGTLFVVGGNPTGIGGMVTGPNTPPLGIGSANLATGNGTTGGDGTEELRNTAYAGLLVSSITGLSYSTYVTAYNGQQFPYLGLTISYDGGATVGDIFFFEPPYQTHATGNPGLPDQGGTALNTWQTWNALEGGWWYTDTGPCSPGTEVNTLQNCLGTNYSSAQIINPPASGLGGIRFNVGFATDTDTFNGYIDNFTISTDDLTTTFDFDPDGAVTLIPEPLTLSLFGAGLAGAVALRRRRKPAKS